MSKLPAIALGAIAAAAIAGSAPAADRNAKVMNVPLPDGSVARVEYYGDVPPTVTVEPRVAARGDFWAWRPLPAFGNFDQLLEQLNRQTREMMRRIEQMSRQPPGGRPGLNVASHGSLPAGTSSVSVVSVSNEAGTCTRTTEVVSQGPGKPPKVTTSVSGNCGPESTPAPQPAPAPAPRQVDHT